MGRTGTISLEFPNGRGNHHAEQTAHAYAGARHGARGPQDQVSSTVIMSVIVVSVESVVPVSR